VKSAIFLAVAIILEISGTTAMKLSQGFTRPGPAAVVVVCYLASFVVLSWALRGIALSTAYAIWSGVGTAVVAAIGIVWFAEPAGVLKLVCLAVIIAGVAGLHLAG
jgi:small multidrug resistance pump